MSVFLAKPVKSWIITYKDKYVAAYGNPTTLIKWTTDRDSATRFPERFQADGFIKACQCSTPELQEAEIELHEAATPIHARISAPLARMHMPPVKTLDEFLREEVDRISQEIEEAAKAGEDHLIAKVCIPSKFMPDFKEIVKTVFTVFEKAQFHVYCTKGDGTMEIYWCM